MFVRKTASFLAAKPGLLSQTDYLLTGIIASVLGQLKHPGISARKAIQRLARRAFHILQQTQQATVLVQERQVDEEQVIAWPAGDVQVADDSGT